MGRLRPAASADEMSVEFASVIVFGRAEIIAIENKALYGIKLLVDIYSPTCGPGGDPARPRPRSCGAPAFTGFVPKPAAED